MRVMIHQPHFMPWLGYLKRWGMADALIVQDSVDFQRNDYVHRNRILDNSGNIHWISLPVSKCSGSKWIRDRKVSVRSGFFKDHLSKIRRYGVFGDSAEVSEAMEFWGSMKENDNLLSWCLSSMEYLARKLGVRVPLVMQSTLDYSGSTHTERMLSLCRSIEADEMICGTDTIGHLDADACEEAGVSVVWHTGLPTVPLSSLHFLLSGDSRYATNYIKEESGIQRHSDVRAIVPRVYSSDFSMEAF